MESSAKSEIESYWKFETYRFGFGWENEKKKYSNRNKIFFLFFFIKF